MEPIDSEHKMRHEPEKNQELRRMKIMNSTLNDPRDFEIIIFKWGDGVQSLKLGVTFLNILTSLGAPQSNSKIQ